MALTEGKTLSPGETIFGLVYPFRCAANDFDAAYGSEVIKSDLKLLLTTPVGHLPWRPDFGCRINELKFGPMTSSLGDQVRFFVNDAISKWMPSILLLGCSVRANRIAGTIYIRVNYRIRSTDQADNLEVSV